MEVSSANRQPQSQAVQAKSNVAETLLPPTKSKQQTNAEPAQKPGSVDGYVDPSKLMNVTVGEQPKPSTEQMLKPYNTIMLPRRDDTDVTSVKV